MPQGATLSWINTLLPHTGKAEESFCPLVGQTVGIWAKEALLSNATKAILENYTGVGEYQKNKTETTAFFNAQKENIYGCQDQTDFYKDRVVGPKVQNNTFPIERVYVGPGLNIDPSLPAVGGFQQFDVQDYAKRPNVDELRVKTNPKITYEGRTVDGMKESLPGEPGRLVKNRTEKYYEQGQDRWLKTTGAVTGATSIPEFDVKNTNRLTTNSSYQGPGYQNKAEMTRSSIKPSDRQQLEPTGMRNAALTDKGLGQKDDYNKQNIVVYANERDLTTVRTYEGNLTSLIKSIIAPLQDLVKTSKKEEFTNSARERGNVSGPNKITVNDPNDIARTTIKETTIISDSLGNLAGPNKSVVYDPNNIARTTVKETTIVSDSLGNLAGPNKVTVYDPNSIARTTIKETLLTSTDGMATVKGPTQLYVYDPDDIARTTIRETLERIDYELNMSTNAKKPTVYDPNDTTRTTIKETTIDGDYFGIADNKENNGYETAHYDAKTIQKQFIADNDRYGGAGQSKDQGYLTNKQYAKTVQKQFISDNDYYGTAQSDYIEPMSHEEYDNMRQDNRKESILETHEPTQTSTKYFNPDVNVMYKKQNSTECTREVQNADRLYMPTPVLEDKTITHNKRIVEEDNRFDIRILDSLATNPYVKNISDGNF